MEECASVNLLFPTVIYQKDSKNLISKDIIKKSRSICKEYGKNTFITECLTTVETYQNVLDLKEFEDIRNFIITGVSEFINFMGFDKTRNYKIGGSWLNYYAPGNLQELHMHHNSMISGCFYLLSNGESDFYVRNPSYTQQPLMPFLEVENEYNQNTVTFKSAEGKLILFMSSVLHGTIPTKKERISLSFNIID
jgi:uncharacterized protein (TIGR02466 family)